jgi:glycosyltransferase involved in cell wall biosynthesis
VHVIPNGYDPEALETAANEPQGDERLTLAYIGSLYPFYPLESFLRVCEMFVRELEAPRFELLFVGVQNQPVVEELLARRFSSLARFATFHGRLPNDEMAHVLARANAFVAFNNYAYPGTKIFDYMALRRRVLLCYSADPEALELKARHYGYDDAGATDAGIMERLLDETDAGTVVRDAGHLREVLAALYDEFLETGRVACRSHDTERFSRRTQAGLMAEVVRGVAAQ